MTRLPVNDLFIGREGALKEIEKELKAENSLLLLNGIGGIGKTTLAIEYLNRYSDRYDYLAFVDHSGEIKSSFLSAFKKYFPQTGETLDEQFDGLVIDLQGLEGKKLLVVDDTKTQEEYESFRELRKRFDLLVTSRTAFDTIHKLDVETLPKKQARELFLQYYDTDEDIDALLEYLGHHTLFIKLTAQTLANSHVMTVERLKQRFTDGEFTSIRDNFTEKGFDAYLDDLFESNDLKDRASMLLRRMALFPSIEIGFDRLKALLCIDDEDIDAFDADLSTLARTGWLIWNDKSYRLHQIIREYLLARHALSYEEYADIVQYFIDRLYYEPTESPLDKAEYLPFADSIAYMIEAEDEKVATFLNNLSSIYQATGALPKALEYQQEAVSIREALLGAQHPDLAQSYNNLSSIYQDMGALPKALEYQLKDVSISEAVLGAQHPDLAISYANISQIYLATSDIEDAKMYIDKAEKIFLHAFPKGHPYLDTTQQIKEYIYQS